jgi:hypothetical protein
VKLTAHHQLVPKLRKRGSKYPLHHTPSWCSAYLVKHRDNYTFLPCNFTRIFWIQIFPALCSETLGISRAVGTIEDEFQIRLHRVSQQKTAPLPQKITIQNAAHYDLQQSFLSVSATVLYWEM